MAVDWAVERSTAAIEDILAIWDYLSVYDEAAANRFVLSVEEAICRLSDFPHLGAGREQLPRDIRAISLHPFLVFYRVFAAQRRIQIVRVVDARRDLTSLDLDP